jgi:UDP-N-acetylmuramoyl-tripeptide--D-alanyl-D-alanine ligase
MMTLHDALALLGGAATLHGDGAVRIARVHTDTRSLQRGDLFVALRGERFDGHDFLPQARAAGAAAVLAERGVADCGLPGLQVADALASLQRLAAAWRRARATTLIAVTGSNGKTTVTQMIAAILRAWLGDDALATRGNLNNHIGVPLTLLRLRDLPAHRVAVVELGTNHEGEIAQLAQLAAPTVALVNNTQREHQEFLHGLQAVARENGSVIEALPEDGVAVFPLDDPGTVLWRRLAGARRTRSFALDAAADVRGQARWHEGAWQLAIDAPEGRLQTRVAAAGVHNAKNALAAAACALAAGVPPEAIARGLADFAPVAGRSRLLELTWQGRALRLVDDSYNANPDSVRAAIDLLAELPGPRWLLLADMAEVGDEGPAFHAEVGQYAAARGIETLWTFGTQSAQAAHAAQACDVRHFASMDELLGQLRTSAPQAASVLVKGSRSMRMERVVEAFIRSGEGDHAA